MLLTQLPPPVPASDIGSMLPASEPMPTRSVAFVSCGAAPPGAAAAVAPLPAAPGVAALPDLAEGAAACLLFDEDPHAASRALTPSALPVLAAEISNVRRR